MGKYKEQPRYNVVSIRVNAEEKALLEELSRRDRTNISNLMREAIAVHTQDMDVSANRP